MRLRSLLAPFLLLCGSLLFALLLAEIALRIFGISYPYFVEVDEWTGHKLRPNTAAWQTDENRAYFEINADGLRDYNHSFKKDPRNIRIAILGDSFSEARQVELEETYWSVAKRELQQCPAANGRHVEVINFGVTSYDTTQELMTLRHRVWQYQPDIIVLQFFASNDVFGNYNPTHQPVRKPYYTLDNGSLVLNSDFLESPFYKSQTSFKAHAAFFLLDHLRLAQVLNRVRLVMRERSAAESPAEGLDAGLTTTAIDPANPQNREAWDLQEALLKVMAQEVEDHNARFLVMTIPDALQVHPDSTYRNERMQELGINLENVDEKMRSMGLDLRFPVLLLTPTLRKIAEREKIFLHGFPGMLENTGHWNERGHEIAGKALAEDLCARGLFGK